MGYRTVWAPTIWPHDRQTAGTPRPMHSPRGSLPCRRIPIDSCRPLPASGCQLPAFDPCPIPLRFIGPTVTLGRQTTSMSRVGTKAPATGRAAAVDEPSEPTGSTRWMTPLAPGSPRGLGPFNRHPHFPADTKKPPTKGRRLVPNDSPRACARWPIRLTCLPSGCSRRFRADAASSARGIRRSAQT